MNFWWYLILSLTHIILTEATKQQTKESCQKGICIQEGVPCNNVDDETGCTHHNGTVPDVQNGLSVSKKNKDQLNLCSSFVRNDCNNFGGICLAKQSEFECRFAIKECNGSNCLCCIQSANAPTTTDITINQENTSGLTQSPMQDNNQTFIEEAVQSEKLSQALKIDDKNSGTFVEAVVNTNSLTITEEQYPSSDKVNHINNHEVLYTTSHVSDSTPTIETEQEYEEVTPKLGTITMYLHSHLHIFVSGTVFYSPQVTDIAAKGNIMGTITDEISLPVDGVLLLNVIKEDSIHLMSARLRLTVIKDDLSNTRDPLNIECRGALEKVSIQNEDVRLKGKVMMYMNGTYTKSETGTFEASIIRKNWL